PDELLDVGVVDVEDDHLGGAPGLATRLDGPRRGVRAPHEADRARGCAPAPDPPLKMIPSSRYQFRIESMASSTERMKQALACWGTPATPMLNHTGLLNAAFWVTSRCLSSALNVSASDSSPQ